MKVFILTPYKIIYEGETLNFYVTGINSSFQLLDHHISMIALLKNVIIYLDNYIFPIKDGILKVKNRKIKLLIN